MHVEDRQKRLNARRGLFFSALICLSGCGPALAVPTTLPGPAAVEATSLSVQPTQAVPPEATPTPGPYLGCFRRAPDTAASQWVLLDADGQGRKVIVIPAGMEESFYAAYSHLEPRYVSPDGRWLAFYQGYAGEFNGSAPEAPLGLSLNLLNLEKQTIRVITPLLSQDYPENFAQAVPDFNEAGLRPSDLQRAFLAGIGQALAWSPDGRYLAFAGQMDGLSSDLYLYDLTTQGVQRLSNEKDELQWISWSPDSQWILFGGHRLGIDEWIEYNLFVVARDGSMLRDLGPGFADQWLDPQTILSSRFGLERYQLRRVDLDREAPTDLWKGAYGGYEVDPTGQWVVLDAISSSLPPEPELPDFIYGSTQLINLRTLERIQNPEPVADPADVFVRAPDGRTLPRPNRIAMSLAAPGAAYWAVALQADIRIYTSDLELVRAVSLPSPDASGEEERRRPDDMFWSPDASDLFVRYAANLYHLNRVEGAVELVETDLSSSCGWFHE